MASFTGNIDYSEFADLFTEKVCELDEEYTTWVKTVQAGGFTVVSEPYDLREHKGSSSSSPRSNKKRVTYIGLDGKVRE